VSTQKDEYHTLAYEDKLLVRPGAPGDMIDVCYRQEQIVRSSMRPIIATVLDREKALLAECRQLLYTLGCTPRMLRQARVDSFTVQVPRKLIPSILELDKMTYANTESIVGAHMCDYPTSESKALVYKTELLPLDSPTLIVTDPTSFAPITKGTQSNILP
jgi:hypothetical protein